MVHIEYTEGPCSRIRMGVLFLALVDFVAMATALAMMQVRRRTTAP